MSDGMIKSTHLASLLAVLIAGLALMSSTAMASGLKDRVLVLPPYVESDYEMDAESLWRTVYRGYADGLSEYEVIPLEKVIAAMEGDTVFCDLLAIDEGIVWGQRLDADYVIMVETHGQTVSIQRLDPWSTELFGPLIANHPLEAVRDLEPDRWVYGRQICALPDKYNPPQLHDANNVLTAWLHENGEYPPDAMIELQGCIASVAVSVSPEGVPIDVRIFSVDPQDYGFEVALIKVLWVMRFEPAKRGDKIVHGMWTSTVDISPTM
jgi:hypothetical protein